MATPDESPFRCSICFNNKEGRQPRALSCLHSFCEECLKVWHEKRHREGHCARTHVQVECPTCRTKTTLKSGGVSSLPMDINVQQFADYLTKGSKFTSCQLCKSKKGMVFCSVCSVILCEDCRDEHKKSPLFASHVLTENICERHRAPFQSVCITCLCGVCFHCVCEDIHKGHALEEMSVGIKNIKQKVKKCTVKLEELVRTGDKDVSEKRTYIRKFQGIEDMKTRLDVIKREVEKLEKEITDHEKLCNAKIDDVFKKYEVNSKLASAAILNGTDLLDEDDNIRILNMFKTAELPNAQMCSQLKAALSSVPQFDSISFSNCRLENVDDAIEALTNCKLVCGTPDVPAIPVTPAPPVHILEIKSGDGWGMEYPARLCGTPKGDVIVCSLRGGPVYKVTNDLNKARLLDNGIAACVDGDDIYVISTDGGTVTRVNQDGTTVNYEIKPPTSKPCGLAVSGGICFTLTYDTINKQSLRNFDCRETLSVEGCENLSDLQKIRHGGMTKLVVTSWDTHEVVICDQAGSVLTRFGGLGGKDGKLYCPVGISRMSNGHLLVSDHGNHRLVEYTVDGTFVRNLLKAKDGVKFPRGIVVKYPDLWCADGQVLNLFSFSEFLC